MALGLTVVGIGVGVHSAGATTPDPCKYSLTFDATGTFTSALPDRTTVDTVMADHSYPGGPATPPGDVAATRVIVNDATKYILTSIVATDTDGVFTTNGPASELEFDATYHGTGHNNGVPGPYPNAYFTTVTICATDLVTATPSPAATATPSPTSTPTATPTPTAHVTTSTTTPGATDTVTASGFTPGETTTAVLHSVGYDLGKHVANGHGIVTFTFTVPTNINTGSHTITLTGSTSHHVATAHLTVTSGTAGAELANTGASHTGQELTGGIGAILIGSGLVVFGIRRRQVVQP